MQPVPGRQDGFPKAEKVWHASQNHSIMEDSATPEIKITVPGPSVPFIKLQMYKGLEAEKV